MGPRAPEDMPSCSVHSVRRAAATLPETPFLSEIKVVACASNFRCQYAVGVVCTAKRTLRSLYRRAHPHYMLEQAHRCLAHARALSLGTSAPAAVPRCVQALPRPRRYTRYQFYVCLWRACPPLFFFTFVVYTHHCIYSTSALGPYTTGKIFTTCDVRLLPYAT